MLRRDLADLGTEGKMFDHARAQGKMQVPAELLAAAEPWRPPEAAADDAAAAAPPPSASTKCALSHGRLC